MYYLCVARRNEILFYSVLEHITTTSSRSFIQFMYCAMEEIILSNIQSILLFRQLKVISPTGFVEDLLSHITSLLMKCTYCKLYV